MLGLNRNRAKKVPDRAGVSEYVRLDQNQLPEAEAIRLAQRGDVRAFERLYQLHSRRVYAVCLRMVANPTEAEDLVQEAFLQVFRKIRTFRGEAAFSTWLHRLAVNIMFMHLRRKQLPVASLDEIVESQQESGGRVEEAGGPDPSLAGLIDRVNLERALTQLTWAHRMVFVLHDVVGYKHREIAGILDCSVGNSKALLHRARRRLRSLLQETFRDLPFAFGIAGHRNQSSLLH